MFHPQGPSFWELTQQALSSTRRGYDLLAPKFDYTPFRTPEFLLQHVAPLISEAGEIDVALDACCGTGAGLEMLRPLCRRAVVGVDFSEPMLRVAERRVPDAVGSAAIRLTHGDVFALPFGDLFDVVVCFGALGHILPSQQEHFVQQIAKTLRVGGRFVFATSPKPPLFTRRYWLSRGFNAVMHVRNWVVQPPFVMFYLTFLLEEAQEILRRNGFSIDVRRDVFPKPFDSGCVVIATKT